MQLKAAEKNYPIHEKELLAIIRALKKWRADLLGLPIYIYTDHKTLENFNTQKDLSCCQLCWQEFLSQYEVNILVLKTLSQMPFQGYLKILLMFPLCMNPGNHLSQLYSPYQLTKRSSMPLNVAMLSTNTA
jgi:hypothetical protein